MQFGAEPFPFVPNQGETLHFNPTTGIYSVKRPPIADRFPSLKKAAATIFNWGMPKKPATAIIVAASLIGLGLGCLPRLDMTPLASEFLERNSGVSMTAPDCKSINESFTWHDVGRFAANFVPLRRATREQVKFCASGGRLAKLEH